MNHPWNKTFAIDTQQARNFIESQFSIAVQTICHFGEGFDNTAFLVNESLVFRFPHRQEAIACMENELLMVPYLAQHLSFHISQPIYQGRPSTLFPYPFSGALLVPGQPLAVYPPTFANRQDFAIKLADWLRELHAVPLNPEHVLKFSNEVIATSWRFNTKHYVQRHQEMLSGYAACFEQTGIDPAQIAAANNIIGAFSFNLQTKCYVHGDVHFRHIIINDGKPTGLIDWGDVEISHPGLDLSAGVMLFDEPYLEIFYQRYGADIETGKIAAYRAFCAAMAHITYAYTVGDSALAAWATTALKRSMRLLVSNY